MRFIPIRTKPLIPPRDDLYAVLNTSLPRLREGDILFITSKILAIHQGRCIKITPGINKEHLIRKEAEQYLPSRLLYFSGLSITVNLTIKGHTLIPAAGIDESNGDGYYILWPKRTSALLKEFRRYLQKRFRIKKLGLIATDSHTTPLRMGVTGISIASVGMEPIRDCRGKRDIFGRKLKYTRVNMVDALAAMAVLLMGEGNERTPLLVLRGAKDVSFTNADTRRKLYIPSGKDLYTPLLHAFRKKKK